MIPQMQNLYAYIKKTLMPEMAKSGVPKLPESSIRELAEKGHSVLTFGCLSVGFRILEKDLYSPYRILSEEEEQLVKKYE